MGFLLKDIDENGEVESFRPLQNIPGNAVSYTHPNHIPAIQIDPKFLEPHILYYMFANSKVYLIEREKDYVKVSTVSEEAVDEFERATGREIPKQSVAEIEYKIVQKEVL
jgi:hypothetical protein